MMHSTVLNNWFSMAKDDAVEIDPDDINHEARTNMWSFSPTDEETPQIHAADIVAFIGELIAARSSALVGEEMLFYCWHDAQCRQLRFSLVSRSHGRLPFRCELRETQDLALIADRVVNGDWRNEDFMQAPSEEGDAQEQAPFILPVFVAPVP
ncbi:hypothetical protein [Janthinobacterium lividum]|uniref:hypothetical protein n=1 Tax=Janthinobacterium lividum TaxID=29581 RepID=UPI000892F0F3|nr:hypothetical protein [Janthinobacterium lividum]MCC7713366.1 hypothetical protein [Janthinobacterium lividum]OEZ61185.1 hypothetical protein JANLI_12710 [Janthinobacterium lividum]WQE26434.1 hypothetical protein U0004_15650 [Janthinobacterium lividum]STQ97327.1 Uncharacterised protein [Janthinobacterium lividum]